MKSRIVLVNQGSQLLKADFIDVLKTWLDLYAYIEISGSSNESIKTGLLKVAASLYVIDELKNSPAAYRVNKARNLAINRDKIEKIKILISDALMILTS
jgi:hypothetical protein